MLHSMETVETLHRKDGTTIQLLGLNILPEMRSWFRRSIIGVYRNVAPDGWNRIRCGCI